MSHRAVVVLLAALLPAACSRAHPSDGADAAGTLQGARSRSPRAFGADCVADTDCAPGICFHKRLKVPGAGPEQRDSGDPVEPDGYCSIRCETNADCPSPPTNGRCGARGMCKRPEGP